MAMPRKDITGQKFARLTVVSFSHTTREAHWHCVCECGGSTVVRGSRLRSGETVSCGCYARDVSSAVHRTHGMTKTRTYASWKAMLARTGSPTNKDWANYGGRGIKVCDRWKSFELFLEDMGEAPSRLTLERKDVNGDYEPSNCVWATKKVQARNQRDRHWVSYRGRKMTLAEACEVANANVDWHKARNRMRCGWPVDRAVEYPGDGRTTR
jgi:hypothetical protein